MKKNLLCVILKFSFDIFIFDNKFFIYTENNFENYITVAPRRNNLSDFRRCSKGEAVSDTLGIEKIPPQVNCPPLRVP